ncbi:hypothetical protein DID88_008079 [Monilinia fructigena]|uniref:Piwi domain-containing protein n=1 Tax=Monilinia fructigena TaxID=38457 RepID=A0A395J4B2_9HELO|nr:hypothetical protein DID88_008079 [Monilinia fructigena]
MNLSGLKNNLPGQSSRQNQQLQSQRQIQTQGQPSAVSREETQQQREKIEAAIAIKNANREKWTQASLSLAAYPSLHEIPPAGPNSIKANFFHVTIDPDDFDLRRYHMVFGKMLGRDSKGNITYRDVFKPELKREIINKMPRKNVPITAYVTDYFCYIISVGRLYDDFGDNVGNTVTKSHMRMSGNVEFPSLAMSNRVVYDRHVNVAELRRFINRDSERDVRFGSTVPPSSELLRYLRGVKVTFVGDRSDPKTMRAIRGIDNQKVKMKTFSLNNEQTVSVWQHMSNVYGQSQQNCSPDAWCINVGGIVTGTETWYPADMLNICMWQPAGKKPGLEIVDPMLLMATRTPAPNQKALRDHAMPFFGVEGSTAMPATWALTKVARRSLGDTLSGVAVVNDYPTLYVINISPKNRNADKFVTELINQLKRYGLEINFKLGGISHRMLRMLEKVKDGGCPSQAGVVATRDQDYMHYLASARLQPHNTEFIEGLQGMVEERLEAYHQYNGQLPAHILFYRDGVGETQYGMVFEEELPQVRAACASIAIKHSGRQPSITLLVVGKRHHARFFPNAEVTHPASTMNLIAGTVVDRDVTDPNRTSFYLQSHDSALGTARTGHYVVIIDESRYGLEQLQSLTNNICFMGSRATKGLSVCTPAKYADILCNRLRCYMYPALTRKMTNVLNNATVDQYRQNNVIWGSAAGNPWHHGVNNIVFYL